MISSRKYTLPTPSMSRPWTNKMAKLLLIPHNKESLVAPALVLKATDYWPRIFLHAVWRELQAGNNQGRRFLRVIYSGLDLVCMYEYPSAATGERQITQEDFTPNLQLNQIVDGLGMRRFRMPPYACTSFVMGHVMHAYISQKVIKSPRLNNSKLLCHSFSAFTVDSQRSYMAIFGFCSVTTPHSDHSDLQSPSTLALTPSRFPRRKSRPLAEHIVVDSLPTGCSTIDPASSTVADVLQVEPEKRPPIPGNPKRKSTHIQRTLLPKTAPAKSVLSTLTAMPSSLAQSTSGDVFTDNKSLDWVKFSSRGDVICTAGRFTGTGTGTSDDVRGFPTLPTFSSNSSSSSISTLATPASPSPAPRHVRRAQGRLSLPTPTPTGTKGDRQSQAMYRNSLDLTELIQIRDAKERSSRVQTLEKENLQRDEYAPRW
ncbi:hypothetical protein B0F90DRAFT_299190 [Multifurca ochricompacta]|uniref:Uncharacterized protein n=1 Tax=Multifurca ochricompacta TaxID=376703 RepID=A0AAD4LWE8_9AGAM|nr:hypothetical protein B0F90DRAFT_299190 [Multifurca ochricompacta]